MTDQQAPELIVNEARLIILDIKVNCEDRKLVSRLKKQKWVTLSSVQAREAWFNARIKKFETKIHNILNKDKIISLSDAEIISIEKICELQTRIKELEMEIQVMKPLYDLYKKVK